MSYRSHLYETRKWYISHEILCAEPDDQTIDEPLTVWENLILIKANGPEEAYEKAMEHGRISENEIRIDGKKGRHRFAGLKELMLVYDNLEHGAELEWYEMQLTKAQIDELTKQKEQLHAFNSTNFED